ncbi:MAG TPA: hypothetical protein VJB59_01225 [Bdellovibrionota bacterium]|nr:hypothetical protein [Bdellovibrionota bacterium]
MSLLKRYRKWKQRDFLRWRGDLTDYERDFFLPELKGRCEELLKYCKEINSYCDNRVDERAFGVTLRELVIDSKYEQLVPPERRPSSPEFLARQFFTQMKEMNRITFIEPLERVIARFKPNVDLQEYGTILNEVNHVCSTVVQTKQVLFLYSLRSYVIAIDPKTSQPIGAESKELAIILAPFKNILENICGVANSTSESIHHWHKEQMQWKTEFLKVTSERIAQRNNLLTILVAIAVSWAFLTATQPLEKYQLGKENEKLKNQAMEILKQKQSLEERNQALSFKIDELSKALLQVKTTGARK